MTGFVLTGAQVFDGTRLLDGHAVVVDAGMIMAVVPETLGLPGARVVLKGGILAPGLIDLQVNGGAGLMVDGSTDLAALRRICATHLALGSAGILPTLITNTADATAQVIAVAIAAGRENMPGFLGLHLEGPHLDPRRKGAHDAGLIRRMTDDDLAQLCGAARHLPALMVTVAPESVSPAQIARLAAAGVIVSLGHSDCSHDVAVAAIKAGASCATHLFNAMSQLGNREPGLVGAVLGSGIATGLIADGIHVAAATMQVALQAKPEGVFLVSDCMAFAGSDLRQITLNGRVIRRGAGRLTLADGTLAGADLALPQAIRYLVQTLRLPVARAIAMATSVPAGVIKAAQSHGFLAAGRAAHLVHFDPNWEVGAVWYRGERID